MTRLRLHWRFRKGAALGCAALLGVVGGAVPTIAAATDKTGNAEERIRSASSAKAADFDFDKGNVAFDVIFPVVNPAVRKHVSLYASDATIVLRIVTLMETAWFDAIAPYHPTAVGMYSDLGRRPASEGATNRNRNIAILYATQTVLDNLLPQNSAGWREMLSSVGLNPDDRQENTHSAVGLGNLAGKAAIANRLHDGMNQLGDEGGRKYNRQPYADYLGYRPVNTATELRNPSRWQPNLVTKGNGLFQSQQFVTPQFGFTRPYSFKDARAFHAPPPRNSDHRNRQAYKRQVDEVLAASAALNDERKMDAELFNDKFLGLGLPTATGVWNHNGTLEEFVQASTAADIAAFDTGIAVWRDKYLYDAVRPFSAVRHVYGDRTVTAWGGPGKGTVRDLPGKEWRGYLDVADHPEYPSGSASFCAAVAQVGRRLYGTDKLNMSWTFAKGSSLIEPGITPAADITLRWDTWTDYVRDCGLSRVWGGVHFMPAVEAGWDIGERVGDLAYAYVQSHIKGKRPA